LRIEPPFYSVPIKPEGVEDGEKAFPQERFMDDAWGDAINRALRATVEIRFESFELLR